MPAHITALYRYPVKGLSPEPLDRAELRVGAHFPGDRLFAIENGPSGFDPAAAEHLPKTRFLMLMKQERLAKLQTRYDDASRILTVSQGGHAVVAGNTATSEGRAALEAFFAAYCAEELRGPPKLLSGPPGFRFMDSRSGFLSIIDTASIAAIAAAAGREKLDPLRFRANIYVEGLGAWGEFGLVGQHMRLGGAVVEITKRIDRCAATDVDPSLGIRDLRMLELMERNFGHHDCGVYARVLEDGEIRSGSRMASA
jgi:uncharacterized protein